MMSDLSIGEYLYVFNCYPAKEVWDTLEMIYEYFLDIKKRENEYMYPKRRVIK